MVPLTNSCPGLVIDAPSSAPLESGQGEWRFDSRLYRLWILNSGFWSLDLEVRRFLFLVSMGASYFWR